MERFYIRSEQIDQESAVLDGDEARHALTVKRLKQGSDIVLFDGKGKEYFGIIKDVTTVKHSGKTNKKILIDIKSVNTNPNDTNISITLVCVLPKKNRMDLIVQKGTELGLDRLIPALSARSVVRPKDEKGRRNHRERWHRIAIEAGKQCGRCFLPAIDDITNINEILPKAREYDLALFAALSPDVLDLKEVFDKTRKADKQISSVIIFIGPEGDFDNDEVVLAQACGCEIISLGNLVLKVDTAAFYLMSVLKYEFE